MPSCYGVVCDGDDRLRGHAPGASTGTLTRTLTRGPCRTLGFPTNFTMPQQITFPDTLKHWPFPRNINPFYAEVKPEVDAWFESFEGFSSKDMQAFQRCDFRKLISNLQHGELD